MKVFRLNKKERKKIERIAGFLGVQSTDLLSEMIRHQINFAWETMYSDRPQYQARIELAEYFWELFEDDYPRQDVLKQPERDVN